MRKKFFVSGSSGPDESTFLTCVEFERITFTTIGGIDLLINKRKRVLTCAGKCRHFHWAQEVQDVENQLWWKSFEDVWLHFQKAYCTLMRMGASGGMIDRLTVDSAKTMDW